MKTPSEPPNWNDITPEDFARVAYENADPRVVDLCNRIAELDAEGALHAAVQAIGIRLRVMCREDLEVCVMQFHGKDDLAIFRAHANLYRKILTRLISQCEESERLIDEPYDQDGS